MNFKEFRQLVLQEQDDAWEEFDGATPDHIIFSEEIYRWLEENNRFQKVDDDTPPRRPGYLGMKVWYSNSLDERGNAALLVSSSVFHEIAPKAGRFK
jgi:hypothetical protein